MQAPLKVAGGLGSPLSSALLLGGCIFHEDSTTTMFYTAFVVSWSPVIVSMGVALVYGSRALVSRTAVDTDGIIAGIVVCAPS